MRRITAKDIEYVRKPCVWDLGNKMLYRLCQDHPGHKQPDEIVAKIWIIGRTYSAALERRKSAAETGMVFYEQKVVRAIKASRIDKWIDSVRDAEAGSPETIAAHKRLLNLFCDISGLEKRSLASKYLHFHVPKAIFIFDGRARAAIKKVVPKLSQLPEISTTDHDSDYKGFVRQCVWLRGWVQSHFGHSLSPRELDRLLLRIAGEAANSGTSHKDSK